MIELEDDIGVVIRAVTSIEWANIPGTLTVESLSPSSRFASDDSEGKEYHNYDIMKISIVGECKKCEWFITDRKTIRMKLPHTTRVRIKLAEKRAIIML